MLKHVFKRMVRSDFVHALACRLIAGYIRLVHATGRWQAINAATARDFLDNDRPFILAFWHGRLLMMPHSWPRGKPITMLISQHRDGQLIAGTVAHFGIKTAAGSSTRGGSGALRHMLKTLKAGAWVGITPDGPRGPRMRASVGVAQIARMAGVPVIPATFSAARGKNMGSWDRFLLAAPFSRGVFIWGEPITVARDADDDAVEAARHAIESQLIAITQEADRRMGREPVEPADPC